jgi:glycosyltransferase involved in cell wall biosynthesis
MKILLSAYACEPGLGSEPGVGWNWAHELAKKGHELWIITRPMHKDAIEKYLFANKELKKNMNFIYYDLSFWKRKRGGKGTQIHYLLWQFGIFRVARELAKKINFDLVHHITFVSVRVPSFLGLLGKPFIFGPVAGGESVTKELRKSYPLSGKIKDFIRDILNKMVKINPLMYLTFISANKIIVTSEQTKQLIPKKFHQKVYTSLAIGSEKIKDSSLLCKEVNPDRNFKVLFVGNLLYLKGIHLALCAIAEAIKQEKNIEFTIIGSGPDGYWLKQQCSKLNLNNSVKWIDRMERDVLLNKYKEFDLFLFPSLHDSGGMVVLEALSYGLPVICLDKGGPGIIVNSSCGKVINTENKSENEVIKELSQNLLELKRNPDLLKRLSEGARKRAKELEWGNIVDNVYKLLKS